MHDDPSNNDQARHLNWQAHWEIHWSLIAIIFVYFQKLMHSGKPALKRTQAFDWFQSRSLLRLSVFLFHYHK